MKGNAMTTTISIDRTDLKAVSLCCAKQDVRFYLQGVLVDVRQDQTRLVATDGHRLACAYQPRSDDDSMSPRQFILPADIVSAINKHKGVAGMPAVITALDDGKYSLLLGDSSVTFSPIDATFPDYERAVPDTYSGEVAQFNARYLGEFAKMRAVFRSKFETIVISHNGDRAALIDIGQPHVLCICMPCREDPPAKQVPEWFRPREEKRKAA
jgi:DNA polymerase-3 subunit beta